MADQRSRLTQFIDTIVEHLGSHSALVLAVTVVLVWAAAGPFAQFSEGWQLVINTGTTIITFLMTFVLLVSDRRGQRAVHVKLDTIIHALVEAPDDLVGIECLDDEAIAELQDKVHRDAKG